MLRVLRPGVVGPARSPRTAVDSVAMVWFRPGQQTSWVWFVQQCSFVSDRVDETVS